jgi:hypothetical protein
VQPGDRLDRSKACAAREGLIGCDITDGALTAQAIDQLGDQLFAILTASRRGSTVYLVAGSRLLHRKHCSKETRT